MNKLDPPNPSLDCPFENALNMGHNVRHHFDWPNVQEVMNKVKEEIIELEDALTESKTEQIHELGDVLFTLVQVARHLGIDPKDSLTLCNQRHSLRMQKMKQLIVQDYKVFEDQSLSELETYWSKAKKLLKQDESLFIQTYLQKR